MFCTPEAELKSELCLVQARFRILFYKKRKTDFKVIYLGVKRDKCRLNKTKFGVFPSERRGGIVNLLFSQA